MSVDAGDVFFVRFIRMKTSEKQELSLYPDSDYATCPLLAMALALAIQSAHSTDRIANLPTQAAPAQFEHADEPPLIELLDIPADAPAKLAAALTSSRATPLAMHSHVNRLLERLARSAGIAEQLSSHSFRRVGYQHANRSAELTDR